MKKGFTLIEILLVLGIVLMLATIGLGVFSGARQNLSIDLETDKLIAAFNSLRASAQAKAECFGIAFEQNKPPQKITASYLNRRQGCDSNVQQLLFPLPNGIVISNLSIDGGQKNEFTIWFVPPQGTLQLDPRGEQAEIIISTASSSGVSKKIVIHTATGVIEKKSL